MTDAQYVLCRWEERLWPAQVTPPPGRRVRGSRRARGVGGARAVGRGLPARLNGRTTPEGLAAHLGEAGAAPGEPPRPPPSPRAPLPLRTPGGGPRAVGGGGPRC